VQNILENKDINSIKPFVFINRNREAKWEERENIVKVNKIKIIESEKYGEVIFTFHGLHNQKSKV
jgi:hypothetical protein